MVATDAAMKVTTDAVQVLGGYGYTRDFPAERYMREAKVTQIFEGTNQIQRLVIGRQLLRRRPVRLGGGDVVLVTGGASGLGLATVRALTASGGAGGDRRPARPRRARSSPPSSATACGSWPPTSATRTRCRRRSTRRPGWARSGWR